MICVAGKKDGKKIYKRKMKEGDKASEWFVVFFQKIIKDQGNKDIIT